MEKVTGIGGLFFRAKDPEMLGKWYADHLGVTLTPQSEGAEGWKQEAGETVFQPFPQDTDYFGNLEKTWMVNFRVRDLEAMIAQLQAASIEVKPNGDYSYGKFAHLKDPEGNPIELWQPTVGG